MKTIGRAKLECGGEVVEVRPRTGGGCLGGKHATGSSAVVSGP